MNFAIRPLSPHFGAEVTGLDLARPLADRDFTRIRRAFFEAGVMVVRDQHIEPADQVRFSRRFGKLQIHVLTQFQLSGEPEVLVLSNDKAADGTALGFEDAGRYWHSDLSYVETPSLATMLYAIDIPPDGGDTLFVDMYRAYETLPDAAKARIEGRAAVHSYTANYDRNQSRPGARPALTDAQKARLKDVVHPIVRTNENTGRKALYVSPGFTIAVVGMSDAEGRTLLDELFAHILRDEFRYVHKWRAFDFLCWDNRGTIHHATLYDPKHRRHLHRTTVEGTRPA
jgi:taurine dioxygenase